MSVINVKNVERIEDEKCEVHFVPGTIHHSENENISKYFQPKTVDESGELEVSLRGYPLNGKNVPLPEGYVGLLLNEQHKPKLSSQPRTFRVKHSFDSITHWNWDKQVSMNDPLLSALSWVEISEAIHSDS